MQHFWSRCLAVIAGAAWSGSVAAQGLWAQGAAREFSGTVEDPALVAWNEPQGRFEPGERPGARGDSTDETQMVLGDLSSPSEKRWLGDIPVGDPTFEEVEPAMCRMPDGTLLIAVEQHGEADGWIRIYRSVDGGLTWGWRISFRTGNGSRNPSITYAERSNGEKWAYLAYEATMSDSTKRIMVVRFNPLTLAWDPVTVATNITGTADIYPRVCTDDLLYEVYYVYVTYSVNAIDHYSVMFSRSEDYGLTYIAPVDITGGAESSSFVTRPDIAYGTAGLFVAFEKLGWTGSAWATQAWVTRSTNFGSTWGTPVQLTSTNEGAWHPSVAAAVGASTVMVAYTQSFASQTDIYCSVSTDGGTNFSSSSPLPRTFDNEKSVALSVSDSNGRYHAAFWRNYDVQYTYTDAVSPLPWAPTVLVNEANWASSTYSRPAVCVNPTKPLGQEACVSWTDFRGPQYQVYFDAGFFEGACCLSDETCIETNVTGCADAGGTWKGSGIPCDSELCVIDPCDTDTQAPTARLELGDFQCVRRAGTTSIVGTATDPEGNLEGWTLQERGAGADPWAVVASGTTPIAGGVLANWSPAAPGYRMLRLVVTDQCGHASSDVRLLYADQGPSATIHYPASGAVIGGASVCIDGLVSHGVCSINWLLDYRPLGGSWSSLASGTGGVYNLPLAHWNTTSVVDGKYELRVTATSIGGTNSQTVGVKVDNTAPIAVLTDPVNCAWVDGLVEIHGTAADANFARWELQWTGGASNTWNPIASGTSASSGTLASWDVRALPPCAYTVRLLVQDASVINCTNDVHWSEFLVSVPVGDPSYLFDVDHDGDVDLYDFSVFAGVFMGPVDP